MVHRISVILLKKACKFKMISKETADIVKKFREKALNLLEKKEYN